MTFIMKLCVSSDLSFQTEYKIKLNTLLKLLPKNNS